MKRGRPTGSNSKFISIQTLLDKFQTTNYCIPVNDSFIKKYNLLGEKINTELCKTKTEKPNQVQIQEINLND